MIHENGNSAKDIHCKPVDIDQLVQLTSWQLAKVGKMKLEERPLPLPVLLLHLLQDVGQAGPGNDVLGVLREGLHPANDMESSTGRTEKVDRYPVPVPGLDRGGQHPVHKRGKVHLGGKVGGWVRILTHLIVWLSKEAVEVVGGIFQFNLVSIWRKETFQRMPSHHYVDFHSTKQGFCQPTASIAISKDILRIVHVQGCGTFCNSPGKCEHETGVNHGWQVLQKVFPRFYFFHCWPLPLSMDSGFVAPRVPPPTCRGHHPKNLAEVSKSKIWQLNTQIVKEVKRSDG